MFYSCVQSPKVDPHTPKLEDICPKIKNVRVELKKGFNGYVDEFMETYVLNTYDQGIKFKMTLEKDEKYIKFNPINKEIEIKDFSGEKKIYKSLNSDEKNKDYEDKLNEFIENIKSFDDSRWIYFNLEDIIECVERNGFLEHK